MINEKKSKFDFDEIVYVNNKKKDSLHGRKGTVSGKACNDDGVWSYAIFMLDLEECRCFDEDELSSTGEFAPENYGMTDSWIRVSADKDGRGEILDMSDDLKDVD